MDRILNLQGLEIEDGDAALGICNSTNSNNCSACSTSGCN